MQEYSQVAAILERKKESEEDQILAELQDIKQRINTSSGILTDREKTAFFVVVTPEEMSILDTQKAATLSYRSSPTVTKRLNSYTLFPSM